MNPDIVEHTQKQSEYRAHYLRIGILALPKKSYQGITIDSKMLPSIWQNFQYQSWKGVEKGKRTQYTYIQTYRGISILKKMYKAYARDTVRYFVLDTWLWPPPDDGVARNI